MKRISIACRNTEGTVTAEKCYITTPNFAFQTFAAKDIWTHKINSYVGIWWGRHYRQTSIVYTALWFMFSLPINKRHTPW